MITRPFSTILTKSITSGNITRPFISGISDKEVLSKQAEQAKSEAEEVGGFWNILKSTIKGLPQATMKTFSSTTEKVKEIKKDLLNIEPVKTDVWKDVYDKTLGQIAGAVKQEGKNLLEMWEASKSNSASKQLSTALKTTAGAVNIAFSPISALFGAAEKIPVIGTVAKLATLPFDITGDAGRTLFQSALKITPIPKADKDILDEAVGEIGTLAGQIILGGKIMEVSLKKIQSKYGKEGAKIIEEKAKEKAEATPEEVKVKIRQGKQGKTQEFPMETKIIREFPRPKTRAEQETLAQEMGFKPELAPKEPTPRQLAQEAQAQELGHKPEFEKTTGAVSERLVEEFAQEYGYKPKEISPVERTTFFNELNKASNLIKSDQNKAYRVGMRLETATEAESVATNILLAHKALEVGDFSLYNRLTGNRSLAQFGRGQGIVLEKLSSGNSMDTMTKEFISYRLEKLGSKSFKGIDQTKSLQERGTQALKNKTKEISRETEKFNLTKEELSINNFLDKIIC